MTLENYVFKSVRYDIKNQLLDFLQVNYQELNKTHLLRELDTIQRIE